MEVFFGDKDDWGGGQQQVAGDGSGAGTGDGRDAGLTGVIVGCGVDDRHTGRSWRISQRRRRGSGVGRDGE
jgi:hypothetical protein